ncbi:hypothetical protein PIB30_088143, partial [Stylosanthes scabra]|nr:hypothetical protein [Stylosanthes scabra]
MFMLVLAKSNDDGSISKRENYEPNFDWKKAICETKCAIKCSSSSSVAKAICIAGCVRDCIGKLESFNVDDDNTACIAGCVLSKPIQHNY